MITSAEELEAKIAAIEAIHEQLDDAERKYDALPTWAWIRQGRNLRLRATLLASTKPYWEEIQAGWAGGTINSMVQTIIES